MSCQVPPAVEFNPESVNNNTTEGPIPAFLEMISKWPAGVPLDSMWSVYYVTPEINKDFITEPKISLNTNTVNGAGVDYNKAWDLAEYRNQIIKASDKTIAGWYKSNMIATGIKIGGDKIKTSRVGSKGSEGYLKGIVTDGREDLDTLEIACLETNISYADMVIRPWLLKIASYSLIAASSDASNTRNFLKSDIVCTLYGLVGPGKTPIKRKSYYFYDAFPVQVEGESYNFSTSKSMEIRSIKFAYSHYAIIQGETNYPKN